MQYINQHELRKDLNCLCKYLQSTYNINCGACCFVAYVISKHLDKLKIPYKFVVFTNYKKNRNKVLSELKTKKIDYNRYNSITYNGTSFHYCLKISGGHVNKGNKSNLFTLHRYSFKNVNPSTIEWIYNNGKWNTSYKKAYNKIIITLINNFFKKYEDEER